MTSLLLLICLSVITAVASLFFIFVGAPIVLRADTEKAQMSEPIEKLHKQMRSGDDASIFNNADEAYRSTVGEQRSDELFKEIDSRFGAPGHAVWKHAEEIPTTDGGKKYSITFQTDFDKGVAEETILVHWDPSTMKFRMLGYSLKSPLLPGGNLSDTSEHR